MTFSLENTFRFTIATSPTPKSLYFFRKEAEFEWNGLFEIELVLLEIRKKYVGSVFLNNALLKTRLKRLSVLDREIRNFFETFLELIELFETF